MNQSTELGCQCRRPLRQTDDHTPNRAIEGAPAEPCALYGLLTLIGDYTPIRNNRPVARDLELTCSSASLTWLTSGAVPSG
jgi:hypothetical protein